jgi:SAM-dependent methyltransferase
MVLTAPGAPASVVWHDLECGAYRADLPLWRELAGGVEEGGRILDVGAGAGRVTLALARRGHRITALDLDADLLEALRLRSGEPAPRIVHADARTFHLPTRDFALCIVPMQTLQLLGGAAGRATFLARARAHLRPGALLACAIVTDLEAFDCTDTDDGPAAERTTIAGTSYSSRAVRVAIGRHRIRIERERSIEPASGPRQGAELDVIELDRVSVATLEREGRDAGLTPAGVRWVPTTDEHVGSEVVLLRA